MATEVKGSPTRPARLPAKWTRMWKHGPEVAASGPVYVSMNDYWVHRRWDILRVAQEGMRFRRFWPKTEGAVGLWFATANLGHRQVSISIWRHPDDLRRFVHSPGHRRTMRDFRDVGALVTTAWKADSSNPELIWQQAMDRLSGGDRSSERCAP